MRVAFIARRARRYHRGSLHHERRTPERPLYHDERPVCQLRRTEDDRFGRASSAKAPATEDPAAHLDSPALRVRKTHSRQAGKVLFEKQRGARTHRCRAEQHRAMIGTSRVRLIESN